MFYNWGIHLIKWMGNGKKVNDAESHGCSQKGACFEKAKCSPELLTQIELGWFSGIPENKSLWLPLETPHHWLSSCFLDITTSHVVNEPEVSLSQQGNDPDWQPLKILSHQEVYRDHPFQSQKCTWKCSSLFSVCFSFAPSCFPNEILVLSEPFAGLQERLCSSWNKM